MHSVTDRRTDGQQAAANSRSYCVAVRSANKLHLNFKITSYFELEGVFMVRDQEKVDEGE